MRNLKSHFVFNRSQRNGIFILVLLILVLQLVYFFIRFSSEGSSEEVSNEITEKFQNQIDSLKQVAALKDSANLVAPFNPNFISDYKGYTLGMSPEEIDRLHAYRAEEKWVNSAEDFQEVTGVSDSLLGQIAPAFRFPEWRNQRSSFSEVKATPSAVREKSDLNLASPEELRRVNGIGETLSERIVRYRNLIGGFRNEIQLKDVYGLSPEVIVRIQEQFKVITADEPVKLNLNNIETIPLSEIPYFNYELAREIVDYRKLRGEIRSFEELGNIKGFPVEKIDRIHLYLTID